MHNPQKSRSNAELIVRLYILETQKLNIPMVISIPSLMDLITKYPTIGARKAEQK